MVERIHEAQQSGIGTNQVRVHVDDIISALRLPSYQLILALLLRMGEGMSLQQVSRLLLYLIIHSLCPYINDDPNTLVQFKPSFPGCLLDEVQRLLWLVNGRTIGSRHQSTLTRWLWGDSVSNM